MIEEMLPGFYRVEVPLPKNPLKFLNSYMVRGPERDLIIDTGMNRPECLEAMTEAIKALNIDLSKTDFFISHMHSDHIGLVGTLPAKSARVYFNGPESVHVVTPEYWEFSGPIRDFARQHGFPEDELTRALGNHPGLKYKASAYPDFHILKDGDRLTVGEYQFDCIETPGHTKGHICLYQPDHKVCLTGDHILGDITPNILSRFNDTQDSLADYLRSLDKVYPLEVKLVVPGHRSTFTNFRGRIDELKHHHEVRANEALSIVSLGNLDAYQVAARMTWDMPGPWEQFPSFQKWFAFGEALAHIQYLEKKGQVRRTANGQIVHYALV
ncbi:MAG: MBL fold metallo-hydrolase [Chloroflexi bacterium]|nr:MBL fold metallo-hydrolase [Chloroflexota bacterium]